MHEDEESRRPREDAATAAYLDLIRSVHAEWDREEASGDRSVQLSAGALATIKESVRADVRHGAAVAMPPTPAGPFTATELVVRTLVRTTIDAVPGARSLRTRLAHAEPEEGGGRGRGRLTALSCSLSAAWSARDLLALGAEVRAALAAALERELGVRDVRIDIRIEDLHED